MIQSKGNTVYLYLHRVLLLKSPSNRIIPRKRALWIISHYFKFIKGVKVKVLEDLIKLGLLEVIDKRKLKIINIKASEMVDTNIFLKIVESGDKIIKDEKVFWDSIDTENENLREIIRDLQKGVKELKRKLNEVDKFVDDKLVK